MSENPSDQESTAAPAARDASLKVDASSLSTDELDFAKVMGFGDEPEPEPAPEPESAPAFEAKADALETSDADSESSLESMLAEALPEENEQDEPEVAEEIEGTRTIEETSESEEIAVSEALPQSESEERQEENDDGGEWEEIHPRPSPEGNQDLLQSRAREVFAYAEIAATEQAQGGFGPESAVVEDDLVASPSTAPLDHHDQPPPDAVAVAAPPPRTEPRAADADWVALEKERDALAAELETLTTEHGLLLDHQAAVQGQLVRSNEEVERLRTSLKAARTALAPLPEGERALRAEVLGVRDRLEAAHAENQKLAVRCESGATDLAIAQARFEDRQHEVDVRLDEIEQLKRALHEANEASQNQGEKQRELLDLSTRLRAENQELRSAQSALEDTLRARNLEIDAREEHLAVIREGLLARDRQIIDLNAALETLRTDVERAEVELARKDVDAEQSRRALGRREMRIASLSETLEKIESVMGHRGESLALRADRTRVGFHDASLEVNREAEPTAGPMPEPMTEESRRIRTLLTPWRNGCLSEWMSALGAATLADYYAAHLAQTFPSGGPEPLRIQSLGGDQLDAEIRLLEALQNRGLSSVEVEVYETDPQRAALRAEEAEGSGWGSAIQVRVGNLWDADPDAKADALLFQDALFGRLDAPRQLEAGKASLSETGLLLFADQLRGGALTLSEETLTRLEEIWAVLPESLANRPGFVEIPHLGEDGGVPEAEGPALETLFEDFVSLADVGFGHLADLVVGPARGSSLSEEDPATKRLLYSIFGLDENRSITESLPSRHGVGVFEKSSDGASTAAQGVLFEPEWLASQASED